MTRFIIYCLALGVLQIVCAINDVDAATVTNTSFYIISILMLGEVCRLREDFNKKKRKK